MEHSTAAADSVVEVARLTEHTKSMQKQINDLTAEVTKLREDSGKMKLSMLKSEVTARDQDASPSHELSDASAPEENSHVPLSQRTDIAHEVDVAKGAQGGAEHSWTNPDTKDTYMKMYNEYHRLRSGYNSCHGCRYLPALFKTYRFNSVFDAGCGTGFLVRELLKEGKEAYGVEAASLPLETYASDLLANHTVYVAPLHQTPFKDEFFDFILSTEVFEHVPIADVDRSIRELSRVAKPDARAFMTIGMGTSRFDTKEGRKKSDVAGFDMTFKFHETVQTRRWWLDTLCAQGWYEDFNAYKQIVAFMIKAGYPQTIPPRGWFPLVKAPIGSRPCTCTLPEGRRANVWCGTGRRLKGDEPMHLE